MIVGNSKVQGVYIYNQDSDNIEFTKNDLVVSGDSIYICDAESVSGVDPAEDIENEYYRPYPGSKITTASEFFQYIESGGTLEDRYISVQAIIGILQGYNFGFNMEGVITDYIDKNGDTTLELSSITNNPIDNLMLTETLNRGMIKVSHELSQIVDGELNGVPFSTTFGFLEKDGIDYQLVVSQYTYRDSDTHFMRIQEMSSPLTGVSVYRYMSWNEGEFPSDGSIISDWRNVYSYSSAISNKMRALQDYYDSLSSQLVAKVSALTGSFRFKEIYIGSSYESGNEVGGLTNGVYTVCVKGSNNAGVRVSESAVVRVNGINYDLYFNSVSGHLEISANKIKLVDGTDTVLVSVYKREEK